MSITSKIIDGRGTSEAMRITPEGAVPVVIHSHPPLEELITPIPFRGFFVDTNDSNDMVVNGVVTPVEFTINAIASHDIYIKSISVNIGDDGSPALNRFGAIVGGLINGVEWTFNTQAEGQLILHEGIQTNLEFIRLGVDTGAIGTGTDAYLADTSGGGTEKNYLPIIDMNETFGMPYGLRLIKGSKDTLTFKVQDDLTSLVTFNAIAYGILV